MAVRAGTCEATIVLSNVNQGEANTVQYYAPFPTNPITGVITILITDTAFEVNQKLSADPVRILSGFTITVVTFDGTGLTVKIVKSNSGSTPSTATGVSPTSDQSNTAPFVCKRRISSIGGTISSRTTSQCYTQYYDNNNIDPPIHVSRVCCTTSSGGHGCSAWAKTSTIQPSSVRRTT